MSGDVQPRKRKDKKKRKDDVDQIPEKPHLSVFSNNTLNNEDVNIHVHKDEGTGGGICAKLVFFILFSALAVLIGLIITEHRGLTDLETIDPNSKFSQLFEGWVDSNSHDEHDEHDLNAIDDLDDDHHEYDSDHADEDDHDDHLDENDNEDLDDNDEKSFEAEYSEEQDDDEDDEDDEELEPIQDDNEGTDEEPEDEDADENNLNEIDDEEEDDNDEDNDTIEESKESGEVAASDEDDIEQDREEDDENDQDENQKDTEDYDDDNDQEVEEVDGDQDIEERDDKDEEAEAEVGDEKRDNSDEQLNDEDDNSNDDDEAYDQDIGGDDQEKKQDGDITTMKEVGDQKDDDAHDTLSNNKEAIKEEKIQLESKITKDTEKVEDDDPGSSGMAVKLGVGVALLVVAHLVLVKKWRNADDETLPSAENPPPTLQDRRNTIIVPPTFKEVESDMEQFVEDFDDEDEENEGEENAGEKSESNSAKAKYQELATAYTRPVLESNYNTELAQSDYEYEDEEEEQYQEEVEDEEEEDEEEEEESEDEEGEGEEYDDEEVEDVDDEDDELLKRLEARYGKLQKDNDSKPTENRDNDFDKHTEDNDYENTNIAAEDDYRIRKQIDEAESSVKNNSTHAIVLFDKLLQKFPSSPRYLYGKAMALDILADQKRSNQLLEKSLQIYVQVLQTENVPTALYKLVADRCINRMRFIGQYKNAIAVHKLIIKRFPDDPQHLNSLVVTYLTVNRIEDARTVLKEILTKWPEDGFALVHYGFILKTTDNKLEESVRYIKKGISTKDEGVIDGRFYFHLGDALVRLGRRVEADKIYEEGRRNKVFLSKYQRSLYNVPRLSAKPWWSFKDLSSYSKSLSLLAASWKQIRDEGLNILNERGYFQDESENLRHTGEWKQFELFARGQKNIKNCKICPITCNIINQIPEANSCKRGQTKFSVMHPRTHIWPHCGPTNCRLRVHLGLKIPTNTFIRVADDTKGWKEGELLIFDDSFEHEVWHNGTDFRLILIVDIWHPELTPTERKSLSPI